jgi:DNA-binding transcriptional ArsR family regulator
MILICLTVALGRPRLFGAGKSISFEGSALESPPLKLVTIVDDEHVAKLLSDPMRRAILNILREKSMNETQLAKRLGLTDATINYHLVILKRAKLLIIARKEVEGHGIVQKFYLPSSYVYLPDVEKLPRGVARYYFPINIERVRGALSAFTDKGWNIGEVTGSKVDELGEELAKILVNVSRDYVDEDVEPGSGEPRVNEIYSKAFTKLFRQ